MGAIYDAVQAAIAKLSQDTAVQAPAATIAADNAALVTEQAALAAARPAWLAAHSADNTQAASGAIVMGQNGANSSDVTG